MPIHIFQKIYYVNFRFILKTNITISGIKISNIPLILFQTGFKFELKNASARELRSIIISRLTQKI